MRYVHMSSLAAAAGVTAIALWCSACATQPSQDAITQMTKAESTIKQAEQAGAEEGALPELQQARDKFAEAQGALKQKKENQAIHLAQQAQVDAQYAATKAQTMQAEKAASEVKQGAETIRQTATDSTSTPR